MDNYKTGDSSGLSKVRDNVYKGNLTKKEPKIYTGSNLKTVIKALAVYGDQTNV
jgi:hypothetical protein